MTEIITLAVIYEGSRDLKDRTKKLTFVTNEVTPAQAANLQMCVQQFVYIAIKLEQFTKDEADILSRLKSDYDDHGKSKAQRMRNVFWRLWQQDNQGYMDFNMYYDFMMEKEITRLKSRLMPDDPGL